MIIVSRLVCWFFLVLLDPGGQRRNPYIVAPFILHELYMTEANFSEGEFVLFGARCFLWMANWK